MDADVRIPETSPASRPRRGIVIWLEESNPDQISAILTAKSCNSLEIAIIEDAGGMGRLSADRSTHPTDRIDPMPNNRNRKGRGPHRWKAWAAVGCLLAAPAGPARAQAQRRDFLEPILVQNSDGHHGPVSRLLFADDPARLGPRRGCSRRGGTRWSTSGTWPSRHTPVQTIRPPGLGAGSGARSARWRAAPRPDAEGRSCLLGAGRGRRRGGQRDHRPLPLPGPGMQERRPSGDVVAFLRSGRPQRPLTGHNWEVNRLEFDPTGAYLASGGSDGQVLLWDVAGRRVATYLAGHAPQVHALAFFRQGTRS